MKKFDRAVLYNLSSLFAAVGILDGSVFVKQAGYSMVKAPGSAWPNMIFDVNSDAVNGKWIDSVVADIHKYEIQPLMMCEDNAVLNAIFKEKGFAPIDRWLNMHLSISFTPDRYDNGVAVSLVEKAGDISAWVKVVSKILFNSKPLKEEVFIGLSKANAEIVVAKFGNETIGTTLIYYDDTGTAGLYMVGVTEEYRGKGIGRMLLDFSMEQILKREKDLCVLQSTKKGLHLYARYGFESDSNYNLLYKVK